MLKNDRNKNGENKTNDDINDESGHISESSSLDDEQRVKLLSPGMLVAKRFIRNRLAVLGLIIIIIMFTFAFIGGIVNPYGEAEQFFKKEKAVANYAGATFNNTLYWIAKKGIESESFGSINRVDLAKAIEAKNEIFNTQIKSKTVTFKIEKLGEDSYNLLRLKTEVTVNTIAGKNEFEPAADTKIVVDDRFKEAYEKAVSDKKTSMVYDGTEYLLKTAKRESFVFTYEGAVILSKSVISFADPLSVNSYELQYNTIKALTEGVSSFGLDGKEYSIQHDNDFDAYNLSLNGKPFARISKFIVTPYSQDIFLSLEYKTEVYKAIAADLKEFSFTDADGARAVYSITRKEMEYSIKTERVTDLLDSYAFPSAMHPVGTDGNGMDMLVRLMYGGRVSLVIGFIVIFIEVFMGVIIGGLSGYFGGWIDTVFMRLVDTMNCIPTLPLYIILSAFLSTLQITNGTRIALLMVILGITGWTGIARVVRGQILSLREQEFMTATEATGLSVTRRIFKHLVPNVIPQLIVYATMGLGGVILTEATLSFLNLGVKYPYASWGNIINAVNDPYILGNYWFVWIPAGFLILITVLGFNFIGDGLRDAFDPKMKR